MSKKAKLAFQMQKIRLALPDILPIRQIVDPEKKIVRYRAILNSIKEVGLIEPLVVYKRDSLYLLMDGHLRYCALKELGETEVDCLLSTDDESFTYNARISRITAIQEHAMITKAVKSGVSPGRIAASLNLATSYVMSVIDLLQGIHSNAIEVLKDKPISHRAVLLLKRVTAVRQIEMAELMSSANNFSTGYAKALIMGTPRDQLTHPEKPKGKTVLSSEEQARMEQEMATLEREFRASEDNYGKNMLNLSFSIAYIKKLLGNAKISRFLNTRHCDIFNEFESISQTESL